MVKTLHFYCRGCRFNLWSGNLRYHIPHARQQGQKNEKKKKKIFFLNNFCIKKQFTFHFFLLCCAPLYNFLCRYSKLCLTLCDPMDYSMPGFPILHSLPRILLKLMSTDSVMPSNHLVLCCPLLLLSSFFLSIRVFSNESVLHIR